MLSKMIDIFLWPQNVWLKFWLIGCKQQRTLLICHSWLVPIRNHHQFPDDVDIFFTLPNTFWKLPRIFPFPDICCCVRVPAEQQPLLLIVVKLVKRNHRGLLSRTDSWNINKWTGTGPFRAGPSASKGPHLSLTTPLSLHKKPSETGNISGRNRC